MKQTPSIGDPPARVRGKASRGEANINARLTSREVLDAIRWHGDGETPGEIARRLGVSRECIRDVVRGKTWRHVTGIAALRYHKPGNPHLRRRHDCPSSGQSPPTYCTDYQISTVR